MKKYKRNPKRFNNDDEFLNKKKAKKHRLLPIREKNVKSALKEVINGYNEKEEKEDA